MVELWNLAGNVQKRARSNNGWLLLGRNLGKGVGVTMRDYSLASLHDIAVQCTKSADVGRKELGGFLGMVGKQCARHSARCLGRTRRSRRAADSRSQSAGFGTGIYGMTSINRGQLFFLLISLQRISVTLFILLIRSRSGRPQPGPLSSCYRPRIARVVELHH